MRFTTSLSGMLSGWMELAVSLKCTVQITRTVALIRSGSRAEASQHWQYGKCVRSRKRHEDALTAISSRRGRFWIRSRFDSRSCSVQWNTQHTAGSTAVSLAWQFTVYIGETLLLPHTTYTSRSRWYKENRRWNPVSVCFSDDEAPVGFWGNYPAVGSVFHFVLWLNNSKYKCLMLAFAIVIFL